MLDLNYRPASGGVGRRYLKARLPLRHFSFRHRLAEHAADQLSGVADPQAEDCSHGPADVRIARGGRIGEARAEIRTHGAADDDRIGAAERAMHALPLLQYRVCDLDRAGEWIGAAGRERAEVDD